MGLSSFRYIFAGIWYVHLIDQHMDLTEKEPLTVRRQIKISCSFVMLTCLIRWTSSNHLSHLFPIKVLLKVRSVAQRFRLFCRRAASSLPRHGIALHGVCPARLGSTCGSLSCRRRGCSASSCALRVAPDGGAAFLGCSCPGLAPR